VLRAPGELGVCLVSGAAGFVGGALVRALLDQGLRVRALVDRTPLPLAHPNLETVPASVSDRAAMRDACAGVDTVFHAAAKIALLGGPLVRAAYHDAAAEVNVRGTLNLLDAAVAGGARRFVYTSSADVCFDQGHQPDLREDAPYSRGRRSVYQKTKIEAETAVLARDGAGGLRTCALRPGGIYGPDKNKVIDGFVEQVVRGPCARASATVRRGST
jgi:3beta-hydroxy-delta5-steroid dehydrogenase/steroid delta-isomerase